MVTHWSGDPCSIWLSRASAHAQCYQLPLHCWLSFAWFWRWSQKLCSHVVQNVAEHCRTPMTNHWTSPFIRISVGWVSKSLGVKHQVIYPPYIDPYEWRSSVVGHRCLAVFRDVCFYWLWWELHHDGLPIHAVGWGLLSRTEPVNIFSFQAASMLPVGTW